MKFYGILHRTVLLQSKLIKYLWKVLQWITIQLDPERLKKNLLNVLQSLFFYNTK